MLNLIVRRVAIAIPTLLIILVISFLLMHAAPGGPFTSEKPLPPEVLANIEAKYGLDQPIYKQMLNYASGILLEFDFGPSFTYKDRTVNEIIMQGFPVTMTYGIWSFTVAVLFGIPLGLIAALRQNTRIDYFAVSFSIIASVLPNFVMAPLLILVFTLWLGLLPGGGWNDGSWQNLVLPVIALSTSYTAELTRLTRASLLEVLRSNYIRTARAKGLSELKIILNHALKPTMLPVITYLGPMFVGLITGSFIIDSIFSTGGLGYFFVNSALNRDYSVMLGITLLTGGLVVLFNLIVDLAYGWLDPKIRY
jgi:oligopeptide transport system permease protein